MIASAIQSHLSSSLTATYTNTTYLYRQHHMALTYHLCRCSIPLPTALMYLLRAVRQTITLLSASVFVSSPVTRTVGPRRNVQNDRTWRKTLNLKDGGYAWSRTATCCHHRSGVTGHRRKSYTRRGIYGKEHRRARKDFLVDCCPWRALLTFRRCVTADITGGTTGFWWFIVMPLATVRRGMLATRHAHAAVNCAGLAILLVYFSTPHRPSGPHLAQTWKKNVYLTLHIMSKSTIPSPSSRAWHLINALACC